MSSDNLQREMDFHAEANFRNGDVLVPLSESLLWAPKFQYSPLIIAIKIFYQYLHLKTAVSAAIKCEPIRAPVNGEVFCNNEFHLNSRCTITCLGGYELAGSSVRTCQVNRQWDEPQPLCVGMLNSLRVSQKQPADVALRALSCLFFDFHFKGRIIFRSFLLPRMATVVLLSFDFKI